MNCEEIPGWENSLSDAALMLSKAGGGLRSVDNTQVVPDLNESTLSGDIQMMSLECQTLLPEDLTKERSYSVGSLTSWKSCSSLTSGYQSDDTHSSTLSSPKYLGMNEDLPSSSGGSTLLNLDGISSPNVQESLGPTAEGEPALKICSLLNRFFTLATIPHLLYNLLCNMKIKLQQRQGNLWHKLSNGLNSKTAMPWSVAWDKGIPESPETGLTFTLQYGLSMYSD